MSLPAEMMKNVNEIFIDCEQQFSEQRSVLQRIALALCMGGAETMSKLYQMYREFQKCLLQIRAIGEKGTGIIGEVCRQYQKQ